MKGKMIVLLLLFRVLAHVQIDSTDSFILGA